MIFCRDRGFLGRDRVSHARSFLSRQNVFMLRHRVAKWRGIMSRQSNSMLRRSWSSWGDFLSRRNIFWVTTELVRVGSFYSNRRFLGRDRVCKTRENSNFLEKGKMVISVKIQNFSKYRMMKRTSPLESSREI